MRMRAKPGPFIVSSIKQSASARRRQLPPPGQARRETDCHARDQKMLVQDFLAEESRAQELRQRYGDDNS